MSFLLTMDDLPRYLQSDPHRGDAFRIGIVGCGPRGLYCLQSLNDHLIRLYPARPVEVTLFEPSAFPGAGSIYDLEQPSYLRMNFAAKHIDAWPRYDTKGQGRLNLVDWLKENRSKDYGPDDFVPRATVGEYLHDCFKHALAELQHHALATLIPDHVSSVQNAGGHWTVETNNRQFHVDELVLTVGHEGWPASGRPTEGPSVDWLPTFPTTKHLRSEAIPAGSQVAVRGFGLTWIDAALAMTEGRGGRFERHGQKWIYHASGREPKCLFPFSRSGRPMLAKPDESRFAQPMELEEIWVRGRATIESVKRPVGRFELINFIWRTITEAAASALNQLSGESRQPTIAVSVQAWFDRWCQHPMKADETLIVLRRSHSVATGHSAPDIAWALGAAWRNLYPALVRCVSHEGLTADAWPQFHQIAVEMERIAFGPPAENVGRILALVEAGIVDLRFIRGGLKRACQDGRRAYAISHGSQAIHIDRCVDAVLASPLQLGPSGPVHSLLKNGVIERLEGAGGIHVDGAGRPLNGRSLATEGLAIFGRATEGCILGNDTLSRSLHDHPQRWASRVVERIRDAEARR